MFVHIKTNSHYLFLKAVESADKKDESQEERHLDDLDEVCFYFSIACGVIHLNPPHTKFLSQTSKEFETRKIPELNGMTLDEARKEIDKIVVYFM